MTLVNNISNAAVNQPIGFDIRIGGQVQGVGYRPFVYRLAIALGLTGWVRNDGGEVTIQISGDATVIKQFLDRLINEAPSIAKPILLKSTKVDVPEQNGFEIKSSAITVTSSIHLPVDYFTCPDCRSELNDPEDRRFHYPFINCTQCGPRYSIIKSLPYDRRNTTMQSFSMCPACQAEYDNPVDRRFHAEPIACPECGPHLTYKNEDLCVTDNKAALATCVKALNAGEIIAIKGVGGYHLCCDALQPQAIEQLRTRKQRPDKPLAVMFAEQGDDGMAMVRRYLHVDSKTQQLLCDPSRPVVLLPKIGQHLPDSLAPHLNEIGAMLPYSPLHHILTQQFARPMVATSANFSGEPVLTDNREVEQRLTPITSCFLHHDRPIQRPVDDSVVRVIAAAARPIRTGRGIAPLELTLPFYLSAPVLACGGQMKNTVALAWENRMVISPHIGDLSSPRSRDVFQQVIKDLQEIYQVKVEQLICDAHPGYSSTRWAKQSSLPSHEIYHHHAHASVLAGEYPDVAQWLVFTWDGVGFGEDGSMWGGEALHGRPSHWQRLASWRPFHLPGGDKAAREPWRSAAALCWQADREIDLGQDNIALLWQAWQKGLNTTKTSAVGRLFDAAAALTQVCQQASFEGQAPMWLENQAYQGQAESLALPLEQNEQGLWISDWLPLLAMLQDKQRSVPDRARAFHTSLARALVDQAMVLRAQQGDFVVGLCGGVFQNKLLTEMVIQLLQQQDFQVLIPQTVPLNDGGLCYGQIIEFAASD